MKIVEYWDHSREKWAECRVGKDLDDEVDIERVKDEGGVIHSEKKEGYGSAGSKVESKRVVVMGNARSQWRQERKGAKTEVLRAQV